MVVNMAFYVIDFNHRVTVIKLCDSYLFNSNSQIKNFNIYKLFYVNHYFNLVGEKSFCTKRSTFLEVVEFGKM